MNRFPLVAALLLGACSGDPPRARESAPRAAAIEPLRLQPGQVGVAAPSGERLGGALAVEPGERYLLVLSSSALAREEASYEPIAPPPTAALRLHDGCSLRPVPVAGPPDGPAPPSQAAVRPGDSRRFFVRLDGVQHEIQARAVSAGSASVVWADTTPAHPAELDEAFVSEFLADFETIILRRARAIFGGESDVDGDGRIALLFTPLTAKRAVAFFSSCDLRPACAGSNRGEVLYLTPPNAIDPPYNTPRAMKEILAHEIEHLIHHHQKVMKNGLADDPDSAYLLEGFGALAQDVTGLQAGNLYVTKAGLDEVEQVSLAEVLLERSVYDRRRDGPLRGGAYLFVRFLYDRAGGDRIRPDGSVEDLGGPTLVRRLLSDRRSIGDALGSVAPIDELAADFYTALVSPAGAADNPCLSFLPTTTDPVTGRQRGADPFARFHGMAMQGAASVPWSQAGGRLRLGGAAYFTLEPDASTVARFAVRIAEAAGARLTVVRVK